MSRRGNVAVLLTPPGAAAIAVVRLAGEHVERFLRERFSRPTPVGRCVHGTLTDEDRNILDDPVVVRITDDLADVNLHGGPWVVRSVLNLAERAGFALRDASEAPCVAYDAAGELEREVLAHLPLARTELALRTLLEQPEAWAEFKRRATVEGIREILGDRSLEHLLNPPRVAVVGAPNVGKSTLANQLFAQERSITADVPGTTRDWVGEIANVDGLAVTLVDTPGVRQTADEIEREAIERSGAEVGRADLVVLVLDATRPIEPGQGDLLRAHRDAVIVINKVDREAVWDADQFNAIRTVASTGQGVDALRQVIRRYFGCADVTPSRPRTWTARQREIVTKALTDPSQLHAL
jgi:tRNA modification GTPase